MKRTTCDPLRCNPRRIDVAVDQDNARSQFGKLIGGRAADATPGTCYDRNLAG